MPRSVRPEELKDPIPASKRNLMKHIKLPECVKTRGKTLEPGTGGGECRETKGYQTVFYWGEIQCILGNFINTKTSSVLNSLVKTTG